MRIVITGGHISPALAVIENLPKDAEVFFVGRKSSFEGDKSPSLEYQIIKSLSIPFIGISGARLQRKFTVYTLSSFAKFPYSLLRSIAILKKIKPDVVLGFGGYISFPICLAARFLNIPVVIHEQTLEAGAANKMISKWARMVCISWSSSKDFFPGKNVVLTGNPIRVQIIQSKKVSESEVPTIFITGGSSGSHFINDLVGKCVAELLTTYKIIHQTGDSYKYKDFEKLEELRKKLPRELSKNYALKKFINPEDFGLVLKNASLIVARAGINTVSEILYLEKPAIFIPIPFAQNDEQFKNAMLAKNMGLAEILSQKETTPATFLSKITEVMGNIKNYKLVLEHKNSIEGNAAERIISVVYDVAKKK